MKKSLEKYKLSQKQIDETTETIMHGILSLLDEGVPAHLLSTATAAACAKVLEETPDAWRVELLKRLLRQLGYDSAADLIGKSN